jgi:hypothetical protein
MELTVRMHADVLCYRRVPKVWESMEEPSTGGSMVRVSQRVRWGDHGRV